MVITGSLLHKYHLKLWTINPVQMTNAIPDSYPIPDIITCLENVNHIFSYLKNHHNAEMFFYPNELKFYWRTFEKQDRTYSSYRCDEPEEDLPPNILKQLGRSMTISVYVDSNHAGDQMIIFYGIFLSCLLTMHQYIFCPRSRRPVKHIPLAVNFCYETSDIVCFWPLVKIEDNGNSCGWTIITNMC